MGDFVFLLAAGTGAGLIGSTAGLASLMSYPALLLTGVPPVAANVTNTVALVLNGVGAISASRPELAGQGRRLVPLCVVAAFGGALGAVLLLLTPSSAFERLVPVLIAGASAAILVQRPERELAAEGAAVGHRHRHPWWLLLGTFAISIYGGYFGAAAGVMLLAMWLLATGEGVPRSNAVKNTLLFVANGVAALGYVLFAPVAWAAALPLALGFLLGGRLGPGLVRRVNQTALRRTIALAGFGLAIVLAVQAYG